VQADSGCIELPLAAHWPERPRQRVDLHSGKPAITSWQVLQRDPALQRTRLALQPLTGRTHQLRVHLAAIGHAIVGDALYAPASIAPDGRMLLHASELELEHPLEQRRLHVYSDAPF
jgi:tRNA pseudouridine32 synthase/23S rRNA pseudouridine746 synthase